MICILNKSGKNMREILFYNLDIILFLEFYRFILLDISYFYFYFYLYLRIMQMIEKLK